MPFIYSYGIVLIRFLTLQKEQKLVNSDLQTLAINTIRTLSIDAVQKADSGHPGLPMGAAPMAYTLWTNYLHHNPHNPHWANRDRFVLSAGHGSMLLYSLLHLTGYDPRPTADSRKALGWYTYFARQFAAH